MTFGFAEIFIFRISKKTGARFPVFRVFELPVVLIFSDVLISGRSDVPIYLGFLLHLWLELFAAVHAKHSPSSGRDGRCGRDECLANCCDALQLDCLLANIANVAGTQESAGHNKEKSATVP